jgi:hypothetical protein
VPTRPQSRDTAPACVASVGAEVHQAVNHDDANDLWSRTRPVATTGHRPFDLLVPAEHATNLPSRARLMVTPGVDFVGPEDFEWGKREGSHQGSRREPHSLRLTASALGPFWSPWLTGTDR